MKRKKIETVLKKAESNLAIKDKKIKTLIAKKAMDIEINKYIVKQTDELKVDLIKKTQWV